MICVHSIKASSNFFRHSIMLEGKNGWEYTVFGTIFPSHKKTQASYFTGPNGKILGKITRLNHTHILINTFILGLMILLCNIKNILGVISRTSLCNQMVCLTETLIFCMAKDIQNQINLCFDLFESDYVMNTNVFIICLCSAKVSGGWDYPITVKF